MMTERRFGGEWFWKEISSRWQDWRGLGIEEDQMSTYELSQVIIRGYDDIMKGWQRMVLNGYLKQKLEIDKDLEICDFLKKIRCHLTNEMKWNVVVRIWRLWRRSLENTDGSLEANSFDHGDLQQMIRMRQCLENNWKQKTDHGT